MTRIIDADKAIGPCEMNYDYELLEYQMRGAVINNERSSITEIEAARERMYREGLANIN